MTEDDILTAILVAEGGYVDDPLDRGGATNRGITAATLGAYRELGRQATRAEVLALGADETRAIYRKQYVTAPGFTEAAIPFEPLRHQVIDHGILSGPVTAVRDLQEVLGVPVDGALGAQTRAAIDASNQSWVNRELTKRRVMRMVRIAQADPSQLRFLGGWVKRALGFLA